MWSDSLTWLEAHLDSHFSKKGMDTSKHRLDLHASFKSHAGRVWPVWLHGFFRKLAWQKSMCSKWLSTENCMHSHHTKQLRMNTIHTIQLLYTVPGIGKLDAKQPVILSCPAGPNLHCHWPSTQDATTSFRLETVDGDQELERAVKRRYTLFNFSASMPHVCMTHEAVLGKGVGWIVYTWNLSIRAGGGFCIGPPQSLAHWRWIMKLPSNRCRFCTICSFVGSLLF